jgi:DNA polymerase III delta subunit
MKIIILHGEDVLRINARLKQFINEAKRRDWNISIFDKETKLNLTEVITSADLFNDKRIIVIYDFQKIVTSEKSWIKKNIGKYDGVLVVKSTSPLTVKDLNYFPQDAKVEKFEIPKRIFNFLDSFYPGNSDVCLSLFHQTIKTTPPEFIFSLLSKTLRDLYWVSIDPSNISYPSWRVAKLESQAAKFKLTQIKKIIRRLSEIDIEVKTSKNDITASIDLVILSQLE